MSLFAPQSVNQYSLDIIKLLNETNELDIKDKNRLELIRKAKAKLMTIDFYRNYLKKRLDNKKLIRALEKKLQQG